MYYDLLDICDFQGGTQPPKDKWIKEPKDGYVRMLQIRDYSQSDDKFIEYVKDSEQLHKCKKDDVMLSRYGYIGQAFMGLEGAYNVALVKVIKKNSVNTKYLYYYFKSNVFKHYLLSNVGARATIPGFNKSELKDAKIDIKPLDEQIQIVKILERCEDIINKLNKEIEDFDLLIKARFVEMFGDPKNNPLNFPIFMLKDTCKVITGNTPSRKIKDYYGDYIEWIKTDNIIPEKKYPTQANEYLSEKGIRFGRTVDKDSVLMACIAGSVSSIGKVCITDRKLAFNQQINAVVPKKYNVLFLYTIFQMSKDYLVEDINMSLKGILSKSKLEEKKFILPPIELQQQFADFVKQVDKSKLAVQQSLEKTQQLFDSLMQEYFG